jgi:Mechanosensitive ion channel, conserved TM helix
MDEKPFGSVPELVKSVEAYLPALLAGVLVVLAGLVVAWVAAKVLVRALVFMRLDRILARVGWASVLETGDARHSLFEFVGTVFGIFIFLIFLDNALLIWGLEVLSQLFSKVVLLVPQLLTVTAIVLVGWAVATGVSRSVQRTLYQEKFDRARLVASIVRWAVYVTVAAIALVELNIAVTVVTWAFLIAFGALALCFVLAIGLGSKRGVELMWEERFRRRHPPEDENDNAVPGE